MKEMISCTSFYTFVECALQNQFCIGVFYNKLAFFSSCHSHLLLWCDNFYGCFACWFSWERLMLSWMLSA